MLAAKVKDSFRSQKQVVGAAKVSWGRRILIGKNPLWTFTRMVIWAVLLVILGNFVLRPIRMQGISMLPTYGNNQFNLVNRLAYVFHPPRRGDIVAITLAGPHLMYVKRIVGLPGETIAFHQGHIFINGQMLDEPYMKYPCIWEHDAEQIGPGEYYVVGDNRSMPFEDHTQGRAERSRIFGKVLL